MTRSAAILEGIQAARRLHKELGTREAVEGGGESRVAVFDAILKNGSLLLFRPLGQLLGAYLGEPEFERPGVMVTTKRSLHVQRFTASHELGHFVLGHRPSADEQVGLWRATASSDMQEVAADAFASEFMLPRWLYVHHCAKHGWKKADLSDPRVVYQLSLRLGASYEAACYGLSSHDILTPSAVRQLQRHTPKSLKQEALDGKAELTNPWADVWVLTEADIGLMLEGGPDDIVVLRLTERPASGYLWNERVLAQQGLELLVDEREDHGAGIGGPVTRILMTRASAGHTYKISMSERRPWAPNDHLGELWMSVDLRGKEHGLPRAARGTGVSA